MGVVIRAYRQLSPRAAYLAEGVDPHDPETKEYIGDNCVVADVSHDFPRQADGIAKDSVWNYTEQMHVIGTSYSHYNEWRNRLAALVDHQPGQAGPFHELIDFSDSKGVIGPQTSAKLMRDFKQFQQHAHQQGAEFYFIYCNFLRGFEVASDNGLMRFS